ncbi:MAG TPA: hypothetical protein VJU82_01415 [Acidobacteriaceae bacterium]|nr:hypothetical protein [Acidobacteriaceae bacterium]
MTTSGSRHPLRIVIQQLATPGELPYRIIAYDGNRVLGHSDFASLEALVGMIRSAIPAFDESTLSVAESDNPASILYAGEMELDDSQLAFLGLR